MSMDWDEAQREAAFDELVEEILHDHKEEIIAEFQEDRLASFYRSNPQLAVPAEQFQRQAEQARAPSRHRFHLPVGQPLASDCRSVADWDPFLGLMRFGSM